MTNRFLLHIICYVNIRYWGIYMELKQISEGDKIILLVSSPNGKSASFESHARLVIDGNLLVDPFLQDGTMINFSGSDISIDMLVIIDDQTPQMFKDVTVQRVAYMDNNYHMIIAKLPSVKMNRRAHYRLFIGETVQVAIGSYPPVSATLKDISVGGFAIILPSNVDYEISKHMRVSLTFTDARANSSFNLIGHIVRKVDQENSSTILYGCVQDHENNSIGRFIAARQMELRNLSRALRLSQD